MFTPRQIALLAALSFLAAMAAGFALTGDWRPALAIGLFHSILLRIGLAVQAGAPRLRTEGLRFPQSERFRGSAAR